jgi:uncharacterized protein (TIGR03437 family)
MIGNKLLHYDIVAKLDECGMVAVYKARDTHLDRYIARKFDGALIRHGAVSMRCIILLALAASLYSQPVVTAVRNAASYSEAVAPGCWIAIGGTRLSPVTDTATKVPLPLSLDGVYVTIAGKNAPLLYVSATQINALVPFETDTSERARVPVVVTSPEGSSAPFGVFLSRTAPALFTRDASGSGRAHAFDPHFRPVETVSADDLLVLYATGLGPTFPPASSTVGGASAEPFNRASPPEVFVGEQKAEILFAGLAPGFPGVYQINVRVREVWTDRIYLRCEGRTSNIASVGIKPRNNATDMGGDFSTAVVAQTGISVRLIGATARLRFAVAPGAEPFLVALVGESGGWYTKVDPVNRTLKTHSTGATDVAWAGDFSVLPYPVLDFLAGCNPLPGNILPAARIDSSLHYFYYSLAHPAFIPGPEPAGASLTVAELPAGPIIERDAGFTDFLRLPCGTDKTRKTTFSIYVDGKIVASKDLTFALGGL